MDRHCKRWSPDRLAIHPFLRGVGSFLIGACAKEFFPSVGPFDRFIYRTFSGAINLILTPLWTRADEILTVPSHRVLVFWLANMFPWGASYGLLRAAKIR